MHKAIFKTSSYFFSSQTKNSQMKHFDYVFGINPVTIALHNPSRIKSELLLAENKQGNSAPKIIHIINQANTLKIPIKYLKKDKLEKFAKNQIHQGIILKCDPLPYVRISSPLQLKSEIKAQGLLWLFLDQITDPQNFGALIRTSFFLGVDGILVNEKNRCPLTSTVNKVSVGALELMEINCVKEPFPFLKECIRDGWKVFATGELTQGFESKNVNYKSVDFKKEDNIILVFGSEGSGISHDLGVVCEKSLIIEPGVGKENFIFPKSLVDSLNVGVSAGIIIQHFRQKNN